MIAMRRRAASLAALVMALLLLAGCQGSPLPGGMEEEALLEAGRDVVLLLVGGDYEAVHAALRPDVAETVAAEDIQSLVLQQTDGAGCTSRSRAAWSPASPLTGRTTAWACTTASTPGRRSCSA